MRPATLTLAICFATRVVSVASAQAQKEIANPQAIASAKTAYFEDKSGVVAVGGKASAELAKWGRFQIVQDPKKADLIILLSTDPGQGGNLIVSGGQTATIDSRGHVEEDRVPTFNKLDPERRAFLTVTDGRSGMSLWSSSQRWGGLLTGFGDVGKHLVREFEKQALLADHRAHLKVIKSVNPNYPPESSATLMAGAVIVRIVVDKNGTVTRAKGVSGPAELLPAAVEAAKQWQFERPDHAPVTTVLEMNYGLAAEPCPAGKKGEIPNVLSAFQFPKKPLHPGELKVIGELHDPVPSYPQEAREADTEGDLEMVITVAASGDVVGARVTHSVDHTVDQVALDTVRTWRFRVTRGEPATFPIKFLFRMSCDH